VGGGVTPAVTDPREREEEEFGEEGADGWGRLVGEGRERDRVPVREWTDGPRADFVAGPNRFPGVQFPIFILFSSFLLFFF
jgi:hypothetical protein